MKENGRNKNPNASRIQFNAAWLRLQVSGSMEKQRILTFTANLKKGKLLFKAWMLLSLDKWQWKLPKKNLNLLYASLNESTEEHDLKHLSRLSNVKKLNWSKVTAVFKAKVQRDGDLGGSSVGMLGCPQCRLVSLMWHWCHWVWQHQDLPLRIRRYHSQSPLIWTYPKLSF